LKDAFIYGGDDNMVVKGLDLDSKSKTENILFNRVVTLSNSAAAKIGTETNTKYFRNIIFKNIDVIQCKRAFVIDAFDSTAISNVQFKNFYIESFIYKGAEKPYLIDFEITNNSWRSSKGLCSIKNVKVHNINIYCKLSRVLSQIAGYSDEYNIANINISNIFEEGIPIYNINRLNLNINPFAINVKIK